MQKANIHIFGKLVENVPMKCIDYMQGCVVASCGGADRIENKDGSFTFVTPLDEQAKSSELLLMMVYAMCITTKDSYLKGWVDATNEYTERLREIKI